MTLSAARRMDGIERTLIRRIFDSAPPGSINLGLGQPDLPTPARIAVAGVDGIAAGKTAYTSTAGDPALRSAIAQRYPWCARGPGNVVVTIGSQEAVFTSVLTMVDPGDEVLVPDPGYPAYPVIAKLVGGVPVSYPLRPERGFRLDPAEIESRLSPRTRLVVVCSPSNPTGAVDGAAEVDRLADLLSRRGVAWLSDEIYGGFVYEGTARSLSKTFPEGGLVVSGVSKDMSMTGWRIGWVVGPEPLIVRITAAHQYVVTCASSVSQAAALAAVSPEADAERADMLALFRRRRDVMHEELARIPGLTPVWPDGAFYFFLDVRRFGDSIALAERVLARRGVITIPGDAFGPGGAGFLRLSYAASEDDIRKGVRALGDELAEG